MSQASKIAAGMAIAGHSPDELLTFEWNASSEQPSDTQRFSDSFGRFLRDHCPLVVAMLRRWTGSHEIAEDLAQESAMRLLRYQNLQSPRAWTLLFHRIALNAYNDWGRQQSSVLNRGLTSLEQDIYDQIPDPSADPEREHSSREQLSLVIGVIESLPPKCRQVFLLSRVVGESNQAIAEQCGISVRMVEKHISKALVVCRNALDDSRWLRVKVKKGKRGRSATGTGMAPASV